VSAARWDDVVFDCGDTLLTLSPPRETICVDVLHSMGLRFDAAQVALAYRLADFRYPRREGLVASLGGLRAFHQSYNDALCEALGIGSFAQPFDAALHEAFVRRRRWTAGAEVHEGLRFLGARYRLHVLANWDANLEAVLREAGLREHFASVHPSALLGAEKPDMEIFAAFIRRSGCVPNRAVYVGNEYRADVIGSRGAGFFPILLDVRRSYPASVDCARAESWQDLVTLVDRPLQANP
jgi:FMN phosphatase YigB (HAD superfamily)